MSRIYKEIWDQYNAMGQAASYLETKVGEFDALRKQIKSGRMIFLGCGSSYYLAISMSAIAARYLGSCTAAIAAGDLLVHPDAYASQLQDALVVVISRSGRTTEIYKSLEAVEALGTTFSLLTMTCGKGSELAERSDMSLVMTWAFDESICQTRTVSCFYFSWCYLVALAAKNEALRDSLLTVAEQGEGVLKSWEPTLVETAKGDWDHACVMADAEIAGLAEEGALAFKEVCQLPSNFYHMLDSRHGPFVLFRSTTLSVVAIRGGNALELDYIADLVRKGGTVIVYSHLPVQCEGALNLSFGQELVHAAGGLPLIALIQLLTYHKSSAIGIDPENPTGLAPWIELNV